MFQSVIERQRAGRLGTGVWLSVGAHAALFAAVLFISSRPAELPPEPDKDYTLRLNPGPNLAKGTPAPATPKQAVAPKPRPRNKDRIPTQVKPLPMDPPPAVDPTPPDSSSTDEVADPGDGVVGGDPNGDPNSTTIGVPLIPGLTGGSGTGPTGTEVLPFGQGMTPPTQVRVTPIDYTPAAREAGVEGTLIAKCVITREGEVRDCRVIKGLPHMDEAVVDALETWRYRPVTYQGRAVSVSYVFTLRLKMPR
ncbi:TonB family protein [Pyxidicoccus parkwayensis]|uniref:TonB family protein n=1 Tax=Pyxidicoccus parkwayensis TaxID=2813578 RepID=A0ABX7PB00_9BACT|nr:energy transducer TonB [Pyxidicoccus parkwaysis]QSQ27644.1 TonB family protein [Pyxidicoccus parkwaysis]